MGWDFRGLYTVGTAAARDRLTRDELVRGRFAEIPPPAAPDALLPPEGLLVVHGFGPYRGEHVPWDAFWPAAGTGIIDAPAEVQALDWMSRPPRNLVAWMREFAGVTGVPVVLYECVMSAGYVEEEIAVVCTATDTRPCQLRTARTSPLIVMLEVLGARPQRWMFGPHHKAFPNGLDVPAEEVARLSPSEAYRHDNLEVVDALLRRGAEFVDDSLCQAASTETRRSSNGCCGLGHHCVLSIGAPRPTRLPCAGAGHPTPHASAASRSTTERDDTGVMLAAAAAVAVLSPFRAGTAQAVNRGVEVMTDQMDCIDVVAVAYGRSLIVEECVQAQCLGHRGQRRPEFQQVRAGGPPARRRCHSSAALPTG